MFHASPAFSADQLTALPTEDWLTNGGNLYNQRYSPLDELNRETVGGLKAVWRASLGGSGMGPRSANQAQPLVHDGVVYIVTGDNDVFAIDVDSGQIFWQHEANIDATVARPCCGWAARGLGIGDGKIFVGQLDARMVALDERTGEVAWSIQAEDPAVGSSVTSAPPYYDGMVITGFAGGDLGIRGRVKAFDADDGRLIWTFYTVPGPGEVGIVETPVMQEPQQATAATQPFPIGDALIPQSIDIPLEGYELVNEGRIFTPFKDDRPILWKPLAAVNWPPSSYDPQTNLMYICATDSFLGAQGGDPESPVEPGALHSGGVVARIRAPLTEGLTVETILTTVTNGRNNMPDYGRAYPTDALHDIAGYIMEAFVAE